MGQRETSTIPLVFPPPQIYFSSVIFHLQSFLQQEGGYSLSQSHWIACLWTLSMAISTHYKRQSYPSQPPRLPQVRQLHPVTLVCQVSSDKLNIPPPPCSREEAQGCWAGCTRVIPCFSQVRLFHAKVLLALVSRGLWNRLQGIKSHGCFITPLPFPPNSFSLFPSSLGS